MKQHHNHLIYLTLILIIMLAACKPEDAVIELPPDEPTATAVLVEVEDEPDPTPVPTEEPKYAPGVGSTMKWYDDGYVVFVPKGEVSLGDDQYENNPEHLADLEGYWIYKFPVTNGQFQKCIEAGACTAPASGEAFPDIYDVENKDQPVVGVNWAQANTYCEWMKARLPTDDEWEKAARGPDALTFPWGEDQPNCDLTNFAECEDQELTDVFEYPDGQSYYEAFDLAGNTYEWVFDLYEDEVISLAPGLKQDEQIPDGKERAVRGSSYLSGEEIMPLAQRYYLEPRKQVSTLGFRCVLTGEEPDGYANPCIQTAYIPGDPPEWLPGPTPDLPPLDIQSDICITDIGTSYTQYCSDQNQQYGGLDLTIAALGADDVYIDSWSGPGVACIDGSDPFQCFGPDNNPVTFEICATCTPPIQVENIQFYCDSCYTLSDTNPPTCIYAGSQPQPNQTCPAGYVYDLVNDICLKIVMQTEDCPPGFDYNPNTDCCTTSYTDPGHDPGQLSDAYNLCPPGFSNAPLIGEWVVQGQTYGICQYLVIAPEMENCITQTINLGDCRPVVKECKNPSQYTAQGPCVAAGCKWDQPAVGGPYSCMYP